MEQAATSCRGASPYRTILDRRARTSDTDIPVQRFVNRHDKHGRCEREPYRQGLWPQHASYEKDEHAQPDAQEPRYRQVTHDVPRRLGSFRPNWLDKVQDSASRAIALGL